jgi:predicted O-linked N-acetylglucosamine transferase (SPINDLY family)
MPQTREARARVTPEALYDIAKAQALYDAGDWDACELVTRSLLKRGFDQPLTHDALGGIAQMQGRIDVSLQCFRKALEVDPTYVDARNRMIMILDAQPSTTNADAARERRHWWKRHGEQNYARRKPHLNDRDPNRPLRVGYVSGDFQFHSAMTVVHRIVTRHSPAVMPFLYSSTPKKRWDMITATYMSMPGWRDVVDWPDALVVDKIRTDRIDILIDVSSFTAQSRLPVFAYKPAPIQLTGWGYALKTGFPCFDGILTDRVVNPPDEEAGEPSVYLPSVITYEPMAGMPAVNPLPCLTRRPVFGAFHRSLKFNPEVLEVWRRILERLPEARLVFKSHYCDVLKAWIRSHFGEQNRQVHIWNATSSYLHRRQYRWVDLSLDPWPQGGGVSSCDALHAGVPVLTLTGDRPIQRAGASLMTNVGLPEFIAESHEDYIEQAVAWVTTRKDELATVRAGLRERLAQSPICRDYLDETENVLRTLWREWCARPMTLSEAKYRLESVA